MQITDLSVQKKNPKKLNLFIDGNFVISVPLLVAVENKLKVGRQLTEEEFTQLIHKIIFDKLLENALIFVSYRPHSSKELFTHLKEKINSFIKQGATLTETDGDQILTGVVNKTKDLGLIDDKKFAQWWINQRQEFRGRGKYFITSELKQKGISESIIKEVYQNTSEITDEVTIAQKVVDKIRYKLVKMDKKTLREKIWRHLAARGFSSEIIEKVVDSYGQKE